jgi:ubiquitin C-terminal hydrolase
MASAMFFSCFMHRSLLPVAAHVKENGHKSAAIDLTNDGLSLPSRILCPPESIRLEWPHGRRVGVGLTNLGNTCFLNATLQCLAYTAPLVNYLSGSNHAKTCTYFNV